MIVYKTQIELQIIYKLSQPEHKPKVPVKLKLHLKIIPAHKYTFQAKTNLNANYNST